MKLPAMRTVPKMKRRDRRWTGGDAAILDSTFADGSDCICTLWGKFLIESSMKHARALVLISPPDWFDIAVIGAKLTAVTPAEVGE
jgi:hypothetical protein